MNKLILVYPGCGSRTLARMIDAYHLDKIGSSGKGYFDWHIDLQLFGFLWLKSKDKTFVGYGKNWKGLVNIAGKKQTSIYRISVEQYKQNVINYRKTEEYKRIDLPMIFDTGLASDHYVNEYCEWYIEFLLEATKYVGDSI